MEQGKINALDAVEGKRDCVVVLQEDEMVEEEDDELTEASFEDFGQVSCEVRIPVE